MGRIYWLLKIFLLHRMCLLRGYVHGMSVNGGKVHGCGICSVGNISTSEVTDFNTSVLDLSACELELLEELTQCYEPSKWSHVNISWNFVKEIETSGYAFDWLNVSVLDISFNDIQQIDIMSFSGCTNVRQLYLEGNGIRNIQTGSFANLSELALLELSNNDLKQIHPQMFMELRKLKTLNLANNQLVYVGPDCFLELEQLVTLDMSYNQIKKIGETAFSGLNSLTRLYLKGNKLMTEDACSFLKVFSHLNVLDISGNVFSSFRQNAFYRYNITYIDASENKHLRFILKNAFNNMLFLQKVDFSGSDKLFFVHEEAFTNNPNLAVIGVNDTEVHYLPVISNKTIRLYETFGTKLCCHCYAYTLFGDAKDTTPGNYCETKFSVINSQNWSMPTCTPVIVSSISEKLTLVFGQTKTLSCFAVGQPWPSVRWEREIMDGHTRAYKIKQTGYFLKLHVVSLNDEGTYRCVAEVNGSRDIKYFRVTVSRIDIGIRVLTSDESSVVVTWNRTHHVQRHVILYRAMDDKHGYSILQLNEYWRLFRIDSLKPYTEYEICIASRMDIHDKNCIRTTTTRYMKDIAGIHHNTGVIAVLTISGFVFGLTLLATMYKCINKLRVITKQHVFIVNSESRETFGDVTEATFTYENQFSDFLLDSEDKTEF